MLDVGLTLRRLLVALFAAWLPLSCCCRALAEEVPPADAMPASHACCDAGVTDEAPAPPAPGHDDGGAHDDCTCEGDTRFAPSADAAPAIPAAPLVGYLALWGPDDAASSPLAAAACRGVTAAGHSPPPPPAGLRALSVLLTI